MAWTIIMVASVFIVLHNVDGEEIFINPEHIATLRSSTESFDGKPSNLLAKGISCIIGLDNGRSISVVENCPEVRKLMEEAK